MAVRDGDRGGQHSPQDDLDLQVRRQPMVGTSAPGIACSSLAPGMACFGLAPGMACSAPAQLCHVRHLEGPARGACLRSARIGMWLDTAGYIVSYMQCHTAWYIEWLAGIGLLLALLHHVSRDRVVYGVPTSVIVQSANCAFPMRCPPL